jgi:diguanylate cyclase (GGDEF)-like protein/PAS domain S-box-containing protein
MDGLLDSILDDLVERVCRYRFEDHVITYCNASWAEPFGRRPEELVGLPLDTLLQGDELDGLRRQLVVLEQSAVLASQETLRVVDGVDRWEQWIDRLLVRDDGTREVLAVGRDVTERIVAEAKLRDAIRALEASEARTRAVLDLLPVPVLARRLDDVIVYANDQAATFYGYDGAAALVGRSLYELIHPDDHAVLAEFVQSGGTNPPEVRHLTSDGHARVVEAKVVVTELDGTPTRLAVLRDITAERDAFDALAASERRLNTVFDAVHDGILAMDADGVVVTANRSAADMLATSDVELIIGARVEHILAARPEDDADGCLSARIRDDVLREGEEIEDQVIGLEVDGSTRWYSFSVIPVLEFGDQQPRGAVASFRDITAEHELQEALSASEARFRTLAETAPIGIATLNRDGISDYCNATQTELMGLPPGVPGAGAWTEAIHPDDWAAASEAWFSIIAGSLHERCELRYLNPSGAVRYLRTQIVPLPDGGFLITNVDLTEHHALEQRLAHDATHDTLTGLANRALFLDRLETAVRVAQRDGIWPALLFCDLDRFKAVNDDHGHDAGDELLREVAARLCRSVRSADTVARLGGDEFVVLCHGVHAQREADAVAQRILGALHRPFQLAIGVEVEIGVSIGIADGNADLSATALLRLADLAVYQAKHAGRGVARRFVPSEERGPAAEEVPPST